MKEVRRDEGRPYPHMLILRVASALDDFADSSSGPRALAWMIILAIIITMMMMNYSNTGNKMAETKNARTLWTHVITDADKHCTASYYRLCQETTVFFANIQHKYDKYVGHLYCRSEIYAGRVACCHRRVTLIMRGALY